MPHFFKKMTLTLSVILFIFFLFPNSLTQAADEQTVESPLSSMSQDIKNILIKVNHLPEYLHDITKMSLSWLEPDTTQTTQQLTYDLQQLNEAELKNKATQANTQYQLLNSFSANTFGNGMATDYQTILGPSLRPAPTDAEKKQPRPKKNHNYITYASGMNISLNEPLKDGPKKYTNYYHTISAAKTFNSYILNDLYADFNNNNTAKKTKDALLHDASNHDWFVQIAAEPIGTVLRQMLLYQSQNYVLLTQLLETQKKLLTAQVINNALLIASSQEKEDQYKAMSTTQSPDDSL